MQALEICENLRKSAVHKFPSLRVSAPLREVHSSLRSPLSAFTLIEVLVASAILAFLLVVFLSVASFASQAWRGSQQKMEEFSTARIVMNRIRSDLESIVIRPDLPLFPGNEMGFMTVKRGNTNDAHQLSYVGYSTNSSNQVILASRAYPLEPALANEFPPFDANYFTTNLPAPTPPTTATTNTLANGVIGFTNTYLSKNGTWSATFNNKYDTNAANATNPTVAVRVSLLVVSSEGLKHLQNTGKLTNATTEMAKGLTSVTNSPEEQWNNKINEGTNGNVDLPTIRSLRAFERVFFLPN